jgi:hypothetical protein
MNRSDFTQQCWQQLPEAIRQTRTLDQTTQDWWHDAREDGGWRLSWTGLVDLTDVLNQESWDFEFVKQDIQPWALLKLKKHLAVPYYIVQNRKHTKITVLDSKQAMMIGLYGQVEAWISSLA